MKRTHYLLLLLAATSLLITACANTKHKMPRDIAIELHTNYNSQWMEVNGLQIHYRVEGEGEPLVLLHGLGASLHEWDYWTKLMKDDYQVIRMDLPGFGLSEHPDSSTEVTVEYYTTFVHDFLEKLRIDESIVVGNSLGGWLAWEYEVTYPEQVQKMVLVNPAGFVSPENMTKDLRRAQKPMVRRMLYKGLPYWTVKMTMKRIYGNGKPKEFDMVRHYELMNTEGNGEFMYRMVTTPFFPDTAKVKLVSSPTLIMWGTLDKIIPVADAYKFENAIKGSQLIIYKGVGHTPNMEIPGQSADDVLKFLKGEGVSSK